MEVRWRKRGVIWWGERNVWRWLRRERGGRSTSANTQGESDTAAPSLSYPVALEDVVLLKSHLCLSTLSSKFFSQHLTLAFVSHISVVCAACYMRLLVTYKQHCNVSKFSFYAVFLCASTLFHHCVIFHRRRQLAGFHDTLSSENCYVHQSFSWQNSWITWI